MSKLKGRIISREIANNEIKGFLRIKEKLLSSIRRGEQPQTMPQEALAYYNDEAVSFIFDSSLLEAIQTLGATRGANAIRVYLASSLETGLQTVVMVPAHISIDQTTGEITGVRNTLFSDEVSGIEYPGVMATGPTESFDVVADESKPIRFNAM